MAASVPHFLWACFSGAVWCSRLVMSIAVSYLGGKDPILDLSSDSGSHSFNLWEP